MLDVQLLARLGEVNIEVEFLHSKGILVLEGKSGAGKSSLLSLIAGLKTPDKGRIYIDDEAIFDSDSKINLPSYKRQIGYIFQEARLFTHMTVKQNLLYADFLKTWHFREGDYFREIVSILGIEHLLNRKPHALSGGEKQRVAIGRALMMRPRLLLADEPLSALDEARKIEILPFFEKLRDQFNIPLIYVTHNEKEADRLFDRRIMLENGKIIANQAR